MNDADARDRRTEARVPATGVVRLLPDEPAARTIVGSLLDRSRTGFRATHDDHDLQTGQAVRFEMDGRSGYAKVVWRRILQNRIEAGFMIVLGPAAKQ